MWSEPVEGIKFNQHPNKVMSHTMTPAAAMRLAYDFLIQSRDTQLINSDSPTRNQLQC